MNYIPTKIKKVWIIGLKVFKDARGYFFEVFKKKHIRSVQFIQNNESKSLKGLHYQKQKYSQAKLVRSIQGQRRVLDIAINLHHLFSTFKQHVAVKLNEEKENRRHFFIPEDFTLSFLILMDNSYTLQSESSILLNDPTLNIPWLIKRTDNYVEQI